MPRFAVIDFETTGLSPTQGDRATEIAIVMLESGQVVDRFQSLMNAGVRIPAFIESYTGISNTMIALAPRAETVMADASRFVGSAPMVAHNASFDQRFWSAELDRIGLAASQPFACTMLLSRRLYPQAASHKLGALATLHHLPSSGRAHRALADAEMAASLLLHMQSELQRRFKLPQVSHELLVRLQRCQRQAMTSEIRRHLQAVPA